MSWFEDDLWDLVWSGAFLVFVRAPEGILKLLWMLFGRETKPGPLPVVIATLVFWALAVYVIYLVLR